MKRVRYIVGWDRLGRRYSRRWVAGVFVTLAVFGYDVRPVFIHLIRLELICSC